MKGYPTGYIKDLIASIFFILSIILIINTKDLNKIKGNIIYILSICAIVDGIYSINKNYHYQKIGYNVSTISLGMGGLCVIPSIVNIFFKP